MKLSEGDIVLITPGKYHFATVDLSVPYDRYVFKFPESEVPEFLRKRLWEREAFYIDSKKFGSMFAQFDSYAQLFSPDEVYTLFVSELKKILVLIGHEMTSMPNPKHNDFIGSIIEFIDSNLREDITMQMLSEKFHYSKSFINIEFKRHMRIPIMQYVRSKKIMAAHQMILTGVKKSEAAEIYGFDTYSTFYRAYRKLIQNAGEIEIKL